MPAPDFRSPTPLRSGPTVLEMFNTLLRQLRLSIDYALTGSYDGAISLGTKIIKEHEERMFQEAVIKTIGGPGEGRGPGPELRWEGQAGGQTPGRRAGRRGPFREDISPGECKIVIHLNRVIHGHWGKWSQPMAHTAHRVAWARPELDHSTISLGFSA